MPLPGETTYTAPHVQRHSRLTTFFRSLLAIPHWIVLFFYGIVAYFAVIIAWLAIIITGRYPAGLYAFNVGFLRYSARVQAYLFLLSDVYPPFGGGPDTSYPVELQVGPPKDSYSRLSALIRFLPLIVVYAISYVLILVSYVLVFVAWVVVIISGRLPEGLHNAIAFCLSYLARSSAYAFLVTETFPGFDSGAAPEQAYPTAAGGTAGF